MIDEIMVSVYCLTYNHENYIRNALDGFIKQKTNFRYEVIVHDDASTDGTAQIVKEYSERYPDIIIPILQNENKKSQKINVVREYILPKMRGKYVAVCEGDDFWCDENKLQLQFDAMEKNEQCVMCSHYTEVYDMNRRKVVRTLPSEKHGLTEGSISGDLQFDLVFELFHLSSDFFRRDIFDKYRRATPEYANVMRTGDRAILLFFMNEGDFYFIDRVMSRYNKGIEGSYTQRIERDSKKNLEKDKANLEALILFKKICEKKWIEKLDKQIEQEKLGIKIQQNGYKVYLSKEYRNIYEQMQIKSKAKVWAGIINPYLPKLINRFRGLDY